MRIISLVVLLLGGAILFAGSLLAGNTAAHAQTQCNDNQNRWLSIQNLRPTTLWLIKHRPSYSSAAWSDDLLGSTVTPSGSSVLVSMPSDNCRCRADIQITLESGSNRELLYRDINYCSRSDGPRATLVVD